MIRSLRFVPCVLSLIHISKGIWWDSVGEWKESRERFPKGIRQVTDYIQMCIRDRHRPEHFNVYQNKNIDLVLSGHAHGGQFRLPLGGGVIAPGQGLLPKYDAGAYTENGTTMIVSRGIGNSIIPVRINNPPEIVIIELNCG